MSTEIDPLVRSRGVVHGEATRRSWASVVSTLSDCLGNSIVALMADVTPETVSRCSHGQASNPKPDSERRLRDAYRIFNDLTKFDSPHTVRAWFIGSNPYLGESSPAELIASGDTRAVLAAARAFRDLG